MNLALYQVDAFANRLFSGNPAAVIPLQQWLDDTVMQNIALENNLSETVFFVPSGTAGADYDIRWFTPEVEINLCGHATLASAYVLFSILGFDKNAVRFNSKSGVLTITKKEELITMDFPSWKPERLELYDDSLSEILGNPIITGVYKYRDILVELETEEDVKNCTPDFTLMKKHFDKMIITAPGKKADFVSRFFAPGAGINEDPVTGSAHAQLIPFWSEKLGKNKLRALQLSKRGGELWCEQLNAERVTISGQCVFYMKGEITI
ncbi:PhzF family phenazine biosynthesis protein [Ferruginibacter paludis]|uniref:PhzF family phenazine biosynthesis protein n=1 Tax=Ferruginibacter paludis TaxID=1310417 RepID=UPI0025B42102|nr:PhzF family phenazine biosynthesis protein [Ferruginibacter paludis]MDN3658538.1 PhzF family phenazine biosynthesis protein [Ferruginibacter paludis]